MRFGWFVAGAVGMGITAAAVQGLSAAVTSKQIPKQAPKQIKVRLLNPFGQDSGFATFKTIKNGVVKVKIELQNVRFGPHAVHIHENPVCRRSRL